MKAEGLKFFTDIPISLVGLLLFVLCFFGFVLWVYRRGSKEFYRPIAELPFDKKEN